MARLSRKDEGVFAIFATLVVAIVAWWDPLVSTIIALIALLFFTEQSFAKK